MKLHLAPLVLTSLHLASCTNTPEHGPPGVLDAAFTDSPSASTGADQDGAPWAQPTSSTFAGGQEVEAFPNPVFEPPYWEVDGHLYTTYVVARIAGMGTERAARIAHYTQYPDDENALHAIGNKYYDFLSTERRLLKNYLHSLHGDREGITPRREALRHHIRAALAPPEGSADMDWAVGTLVHAYGDTYAHLDEEGNPYGDIWGHFRDGHCPDRIAHSPQTIERWKSYAGSLFDLLAGHVQAGSYATRKEMLNHFISVIDTFTQTDPEPEDMQAYLSAIAEGRWDVGLKIKLDLKPDSFKPEPSDPFRQLALIYELRRLRAL